MNSKIKIPRSIWILGWVSFFTDISSDMIMPLLPAFVTLVLGAGPEVLGVIEGIGDSTASLFNLLGGYLSEKKHRSKLFVKIGYLISASMRGLIFISPHWIVVAMLRFSDRVGKGLRTAPRDVLISQAIESEHHGRAFGFHRMMDHSGAFVGAFCGAVLIYYYPGEFRFIFLIACIPAAIAIFFLFFIREDQKKRSNENPEREFEKNDQKIKPGFGFFIALIVLFNLGCSTDLFLLLKLQEAGVPVFYMPLLWACLNFVKAISTSRIGKLSDKIGYANSIFLGWILYGLTALVFAFKLPVAVTVGIFLIYGVYYGFTEAPEKALVARLSGGQNRSGRAFGLYHFAMGISLLPANILFGYLWKHGGSFLAFHAMALFALTAASGLFVWRRRYNSLTTHL